MPRTFVLFVACLACSLPWSKLKAQDDSKLHRCPTENPPQILVASAIDSENHLVLVSYHSIFIGFNGESYNERLTTRTSLENVQILTTDGKELTLEQARRRISSRDTPIVVTSYKTELPKFYANLFAPETLHFAFPGQAPHWKEIESPGAPAR